LFYSCALHSSFFAPLLCFSRLHSKRDFIFSGGFGVVFFLFSFFALFTARRELFCFASLFLHSFAVLLFLILQPF
jgi:hypothetical protein